MTSFSATALATHSHWLLRIAFSAVYLPKGIDKIADISGFAAMMGLPWYVATLVALAEIAGGLGVLLGGIPRVPLRDTLTRLGGLATLPVIMGAILMVHWGQWSFMATESHPMGGMEFQTVLLLLGIYFVARGSKA
ncbi:MAG: DoxX family protein [Glycocaulis sp.]